MDKKAIYKFNWDCGRQGELEGIFLATDQEVSNILGKEIYFGEVLGKHSDIGGFIEEGEIKLITDDKEAVQVFEKYKLSCGFNPLDYIEDSESMAK